MTSDTDKITTWGDYLAAIKTGKVTPSIKEEMERFGKVFNDAVHGQVTLHPLLVQAIDTEQFQRLRGIKTLGMASYVYPTANHTRFEHSIGTAHLAGKLILALAKRHPELKITPNEIVCVMLAGLLHDIGHGPFSHTFERFMNQGNPGAPWEHEKCSNDMIDYLIDKNKTFAEDFATWSGDQVRISKEFIKELISGGPLNGTSEATHDRDRNFFYEIVSNKRNGIDVDKWDYLARDQRQVNEGGTFSHKRFIKFSRLVAVNDRHGKYCIAFREKEVANLYDMFNVRYRMHKKVYRHRVCLILDEMIVDTMKLADSFIQFPREGGGAYKPSEAYRDMSAFALMDDGSIRTLIKTSPRTETEMQKAKALLKRIEERKLYSVIGHTVPEESVNKSAKDLTLEITKDFLDTAGKFPDQTITKNLKDNLIVSVNTFDYGKKKDNPLEKVYLYKKRTPTEARTVERSEVSKLLPACFSETYILFLHRSELNEKEQNEAEEIFEAWKTAYKAKTALEKSSDKKTKTDAGPSDEAPPKRIKHG